MVLLRNKKAKFDYRIVKEFVAGIKLLGFEVRSLKLGRGSVSGARVVIRGGEAFLVGMSIPPYQPKNTPQDYDPERTRKLLLTKKEIRYLDSKIQERGLTVVPLVVYTKNGLIKVNLGLSRGLKKYDKREKIKERDQKRDAERELKRGKFYANQTRG
jgi:SsrA-binding protein